MNKRILRISYKNKINSLSNNQIAIVFKAQSANFLNSKEWKALKKDAEKKYGKICLKCGSDNCINYDHVKPRKYYPELALDINNIQPLCAKCNKQKGNQDFTDYRIVKNKPK